MADKKYLDYEGLTDVACKINEVDAVANAGVALAVQANERLDNQTASSIPYQNATSCMAADDVQEAIDELKGSIDQIPRGIVPRGTIAFASLPSLSVAEIGDMYNISDDFTTTSDFVVPGVNEKAGSNVYVADMGSNVKKWDVFAVAPDIVVDQTYDPTSANPQSGTAIAGLESTLKQAICCKADYCNAKFVGSISMGRCATSSVGGSSVATGEYVIAEGTNSHAEGNNTCARGNAAHAEGNNTVAGCASAHAEGSYSCTLASSSHAEGVCNRTYGLGSHAEGCGNVTCATACYSHAEGEGNIACGYASHVEGLCNTTKLDYSHVIGKYATNDNTYVEKVGWGECDSCRKNIRALDTLGNEYLKGDMFLCGNTTCGVNARLSGITTCLSCKADTSSLCAVATSGEYCDLQNVPTVDSSMCSTSTNAVMNCAVDAALSCKQDTLAPDADYIATDCDGCGIARTADTTVTCDSTCLVTSGAVYTGLAGKADCCNTVIEGSLSMGRKTGSIAGTNSVALGYCVVACGSYSHAEGYCTCAKGSSSHVEGWRTSATCNDAHAEGAGTTACNYGAHAEGYCTCAHGFYSHAEGQNTLACGYASHAEGESACACGLYSHAEGLNTFACGSYSHAEGQNAFAYGNSSHAEGYNNTVRTSCGHVQGAYSVDDTSCQFVDIVGWGTADDARKNIEVTDKLGNKYLAGDVFINATCCDGTGGTALGATLACKVDCSSVGCAAACDTTNCVIDQSTALITSGGVKSAIESALSSVYKPAGNKCVSELDSTLLVAGNLGKVYNMSNSGTTTADFVEGAGKPINEGDNVSIVDVGTAGTPDYKFDLMSGFIDTSEFIKTSTTAGLVKNDGTIDTTGYTTCTGTLTGVSLNGCSFTVNSGVASLTDFKPATAGTADYASSVSAVDPGSAASKICDVSVTAYCTNASCTKFTRTWTFCASNGFMYGDVCGRATCANSATCASYVCREAYANAYNFDVALTNCNTSVTNSRLYVSSSCRLNYCSTTGHFCITNAGRTAIAGQVTASQFNGCLVGCHVGNVSAPDPSGTASKVCSVTVTAYCTSSTCGLATRTWTFRGNDGVLCGPAFLGTSYVMTPVIYSIYPSWITTCNVKICARCCNTSGISEKAWTFCGSDGYMWGNVCGNLCGTATSAVSAASATFADSANSAGYADSAAYAGCIYSAYGSVKYTNTRALSMDANTVTVNPSSGCDNFRFNASSSKYFTICNCAGSMAISSYGCCFWQIVQNCIGNGYCYCTNGSGGFGCMVFIGSVACIGVGNCTGLIRMSTNDNAVSLNPIICTSTPTTLRDGMIWIC